MAKLIKVGNVDGVAVRLHWTVVAGCALLMIVAWPHVLAAVCSIAAYFAAVLLHEWGHAFAARRRQCQVYRIELYPFLGLTRFSNPYSHGDHCAIAWGGVAAQAAVTIPLLGWTTLIGYTQFDSVNVFIATFVWLCVSMILINLVPIPPLDGALAWSRLPPLPRPSRWLQGRGRKKLRGWNALGGRGPTER